MATCFNTKVSAEVFLGRCVGTYRGRCWLREKVTTTKIRTSKTKKNIKKRSKHQNIKSVFLVHHYFDITTSKLTKITTKKVVYHYYENQNLKKNEKNIESLSFVWFSHFDYLWRKYLWHFGVNKLSRCASCVARCIPPCDLCAYFRNPQGQTISSGILVYLCVCPTISTALKVVSPKKY